MSALKIRKGFTFTWSGFDYEKRGIRHFSIKQIGTKVKIIELTIVHLFGVRRFHPVIWKSSSNFNFYRRQMFGKAINCQATFPFHLEPKRRAIDVRKLKTLTAQKSVAEMYAFGIAIATNAGHEAHLQACFSRWHHGNWAIITAVRDGLVIALHLTDGSLVVELVQLYVVLVEAAFSGWQFYCRLRRFVQRELDELYLYAFVFQAEETPVAVDPRLITVGETGCVEASLLFVVFAEHVVSTIVWRNGGCEDCIKQSLELFKANEMLLLREYFTIQFIDQSDWLSDHNWQKTKFERCQMQCKNRSKC